MKILYITPAFQHPKMRGPTRHYYFIQELARRHEITLLSLSRTDIDQEAMQEMREYTKSIQTFRLNGTSSSLATQLIGQLPLIGSRYKQYARLQVSVQKMKQAFEETVANEKFDLLLFHGKSIFKIIEKHHELPIVVDFCDATSMRVLSKMKYAGRSMAPLLSYRFLQVRWIERKLVQKTPYLAFVSWRDREFVMGESSRGEVVTIGVDHDFWQRDTALSNQKCLIFTGVMNYAPNEDAAIYLIDKVLPIVRRSIPDVEVLIVGREPSARLKQLSQKDSRIKVTGFVDDLRPYLERASVFVAPMRFGSGIQNKVLEAMSMQLPVVTTSIVAAGLRVDGAGHPPVQVADRALDLSQRIVSLLDDEAERRRMAVEGRKFVETHFDWKRSAQKLEALCYAAVQAGNHQRSN